MFNPTRPASAEHMAFAEVALYRPPDKNSRMSTGFEPQVRMSNPLCVALLSRSALARATRVAESRKAPEMNRAMGDLSPMARSVTGALMRDLDVVT